MKKVLYKKKGVTLIEIMFSFMILVVAVLAACGMINFGHKGTKKDFRNVRAIQILESRMNQVLKLSFKTVSDSFTGTKKTFTASATSLPGVELGIDGSGEDAINVSAVFERQSVTFGYRPIDIANPAYSPTATQTWTFLSETSTGGVFTDKMIRAEIITNWTEEKKVSRKLNVVTFLVNLEN
ncbi:MAG: hypothetical protein HQM10_08675 [Candidatus Riflebacteria bacterium]|nr:hypothetical protein [Candidatus Riflebacteria bacterium]